MAFEKLYVPEEHLLEVIRVIRAGLKARKSTSKEVRLQLTNWCEEEELYAKKCSKPTS